MAVLCWNRAVRWTVLTAAFLLLGSCSVTVHAARFERLKAAFGFVGDFVLQKHSLEYSGHKQGLTVIGAGFSRTGTKSIEAALHMLGHRIYDMRSMFENGHVDGWLEAAKDWQERDDLAGVERLLEDMETKGYTATMDFPMNMFSLAFAKLRPEAKVLFSVRDNEQKWVESWAKINRLMGNFICRPWSWLIPDMHFNKELLEIILGYDWGMAVYPDAISRPLPWYEVIQTNPGLDPPEKQAEWIEVHQKYQALLQETLPEERLLVYNVKQGWAPLVPFLDLEDKTLASQDFPNINDRNSIQIVRTVMDVIAVGLPFWILLILYSVSRIFGACIRFCTGGTSKRKAKRA